MSLTNDPTMEGGLEYDLAELRNELNILKSDYKDLQNTVIFERIKHRADLSAANAARDEVLSMFAVIEKHHDDWQKGRTFGMQDRLIAADVTPRFTDEDGSDLCNGWDRGFHEMDNYLKAQEVEILRAALNLALLYSVDDEHDYADIERVTSCALLGETE